MTSSVVYREVYGLVTIRKPKALQTQNSQENTMMKIFSVMSIEYILKHSLGT